jgi:hypothetical protein
MAETPWKAEPPLQLAMVAFTEVVAIPAHQPRNWHRVGITCIVPSGDELLFLRNETVIFRWPSAQVARIEVHPLNAKVETPRGKTLDDYRKDNPRHGLPWSDDEKATVADEFDRGVPIEEIARLHERNVGAIRSALQKMGLLEG